MHTIRRPPTGSLPPGVSWITSVGLEQAVERQVRVHVRSARRVVDGEVAVAGRGAAGHRVVLAVAGEGVSARAAGEDVVVVAAHEGVVARAAVEGVRAG